MDPFSSGTLFFYWRETAASPVLWPLPATYLPLIVMAPRTWLLAHGWRRGHPHLSVYEVPGA